MVHSVGLYPQEFSVRMPRHGPTACDWIPNVEELRFKEHSLHARDRFTTWNARRVTKF